MNVLLLKLPFCKIDLRLFLVFLLESFHQQHSTQYCSTHEYWCVLLWRAYVERQPDEHTSTISSALRQRKVHLTSMTTPGNRQIDALQQQIAGNPSHEELSQKLHYYKKHPHLNDQKVEICFSIEDKMKAQQPGNT